MRITNAGDLGLYIRDKRRELGFSQGALADLAGVSRRWLLDLESGKETSQIQLVFRTLDALGLVLDVRAATPAGDVDLDALLGALDGRSGA